MGSQIYSMVSYIDIDCFLVTTQEGVLGKPRSIPFLSKGRRRQPERGTSIVTRNVENTAILKGGFVMSYSQEDAISMLDVISKSSAHTQRVGMYLGELLHGGELLLLDGQLGSGKTTFTQGLAKGMHITDVVSSPTFTLLKEYRSQLLPTSGATDTTTTMAMGPSQIPSKVPALYHFDLYRLEEPDEMIDLGFEEYFDPPRPHPGSGVCVVEWADKAHALWSPERLSIRLHVLDEAKRGLLFVATGTHYCTLLRQLSEKNICDC